MNNESWATQFFGAWGFFLERTPPELYCRPGDIPEEFDPENPPALTRAAAPLIGAMLGLAIHIPVWVLMCFHLKIPAAILAGLFGPLFIEYMTGWRGLKALVTFIQMRNRGFSQAESLAAEPDEDEGDPLPPVSSIAMITVYLLRVALFAALAYCDASFWYVVAFAGAYLVRAELTTIVRSGSDAVMLETPSRYAQWHWYTACGVMLFFALPAGLWNMMGVFLVMGLAWGISWYAIHLCLEFTDGITMNAIRIFGYTSEIIFLITGALLLTGG